jgi:hypothetical protein
MLFKETNMENKLALTYTGFGRYHQKTGEMAKAREYLIRALDIFECLGTMIEPDKVKKALTCLPAA